MAIKYYHVERRSKSELYDFQLIKWLVLRNIIPGDKSIKILDLGSGKGNFYRSLISLGYKNVTPLDRSPEFKECKKGDIVKGLNFPKSFFDLIISRDIAEHISDSEKFFGEQNRILKSDGQIIVMTPNALHLTLGEFYSDYTHVLPYTPNSLKEALEMNHFEDVNIKRIRAIPRLWLWTPHAFDFLFSSKKNNLLGIARKR